MTKVLLIGDLRTSISNYGAFANSENLINELKKKSDIELKCIDGRSFWKKTPKDGWETSTEDYIKAAREKQLRENKVQRVKRIIKKVPFAAELIKKLRKHEMEIFVPAQIKDYESFSKRVVIGEELQYEKNLIEWADAVLINGEGNIVRGTDKNGYYRLGGLYVLYIAYLSKVVCKKKTYIINHTVDPGNRDIIEIIKSIYPLMDGIYIRERLSINLLRKWGVENAKLIPDTLFLYGQNEVMCALSANYKEWRDYSKKLVCVGDSSGIENVYTKVKWDVKKFYNSLIGRLKEQGYQVAFIDGFDGNNDELNEICIHNNILHLHMSNCSYQELYQIYKETAVYISGRWHTSILALQAGCPIVLWGADSHKTEALYDLIDYPFTFFDVNTLPIHVDDILEEINLVLKADNTKVFEKVKCIMEEAKQIVNIFEDDEDK